MAFTFDQKLQRSAVQSVILAEITAASPLEAWVAYNSIWRCALSSLLNVSAFSADGSSVTEGASIAAVESTAGRWVQSGSYVYYNPSSGTPYTKVTIATCAFYFSDLKKTFTNYYEPRLSSVPRLSLRIEPTVGGVTQIGGGRVTLENTDGFFDQFAGVVRWDNGTVTIKMGLDMPDAAESYGNYRTIATYALDGGDVTDSGFELTVKERKENLKAKLPTATFTRDDYPYIENGLVGKIIPTIYGRVYGAKGYTVNPNTNTIKVCSHAVDGFIGLRVKEQLKTADTRTPDWFIVAGQSYYRTAFTNDVKGVKFSGTDLTKVDSLEALSASRWTTQDNFIYLYPPSTTAPSSSNVVVTFEVTGDGWKEIPFATRDEANGEFTVSSDDWDGQAELSVDVLGKYSGGAYLQTASEIVQDILASVGETNIDTTSFNATKAYYLTGADRFGNPRYHLKPSLYVEKEEEALKLIERINTACYTYLYVNASGQWVFNPIKPSPSGSLTLLDEKKIISLKREEETDKVYTLVNARYADNSQENKNQLITVESSKLLSYSGKGVSVSKDITLDLWDQKDASYWANRFINQQGFPLVTYKVSIPRFGLVLAPGDKLRIQRTRGNVDEVLEVIEIDYNLQTKQATIILGNQRGLGRTSGFWVADSVADWDNTATDTEAKDAAGANGYWTDANGFADATDARSYNVSRWI